MRKSSTTPPMLGVHRDPESFSHSLRSTPLALFVEPRHYAADAVWRAERLGKYVEPFSARGVDSDNRTVRQPQWRSRQMNSRYFTNRTGHGQTIDT